METTSSSSRTELRVRELEKKNNEALKGGGADKLAKHKEGDRLTARERLEVLMDPGSFVEMDRFGTHRCDNFGMGDKKVYGDGIITGFGRVNGRQVFAYSQDFTIFGGSM